MYLTLHYTFSINMKVNIKEAYAQLIVKQESEQNKFWTGISSLDTEMNPNFKLQITKSLSFLIKFPMDPTLRWTRREITRYVTKCLARVSFQSAIYLSG